MSRICVIATDRAFGGGHSRLAVFDGRFRFWTHYRLQLTGGLTRHLDARGVRLRGHMSDIDFQRARYTASATVTVNKTFGLNLMGTYRVNAGTVFFVGYDERYRQGQRIDAVRLRGRRQSPDQPGPLCTGAVLVPAVSSEPPVRTA